MRCAPLLPGSAAGFPPPRTADASGFTELGITEGGLHAFDLLTATGVPYAADPAVCVKVLDRLFTGAERTDDPWQMCSSPRPAP
jgi:hypothetical protein